MKFLKTINPINVLEEKEKFFADENYNPQFVYETQVDQEKLVRYGKPHNEFLELAKDIVERAYFSRNYHDLVMMEGKKVPQQEVTEKIRHFLNMHGLQEEYEVLWSSSYIARTTITPDAIKLRLPPDFRKEGLLGMLYHEIGTHALRRKNYEQQPWFKRKRNEGFQEYLLTEEGIAVLHSLIPFTFKLAHRPALIYTLCDLAQRGSFTEMNTYLKRYVPDPERRWRMVFRHKRGITDTSQPGGFTKDLIYFEGVVTMWHWLHQNNYDLFYLYFGKLAYQDIEKAKEMNPTFQPLLPSFYTVDKQQYASNINEIGELNHFSDISVVL